MEFLAHARRLFRVSVTGVGDIFDFENLLPELIVGLGLALLIGNGLAWWRHRQGKTPAESRTPTTGPVVWLFSSLSVC